MRNLTFFSFNCKKHPTQLVVPSRLDRPRNRECRCEIIIYQICFMAFHESFIPRPAGRARIFFFQFHGRSSYASYLVSVPHV